MVRTLGLSAKVRLEAGLLIFLTISILADGVELVRQLYFYCFHGVRGFGGLTRVWEMVRG
jgi:hypothetical protein